MFSDEFSLFIKYLRVMSLYRCESRHCPGYDRKLHSTQLEECLSRWKDVFSLVGSSSDIPLCYLLRNADKPETYPEYIEWKDQLREDVRIDIGDAILALKMGNFYRFLKIVGRLPTPSLRWNSVYCCWGRTCF